MITNVCVKYAYAITLITIVLLLIKNPTFLIRLKIKQTFKLMMLRNLIYGVQETTLNSRNSITMTPQNIKESISQKRVTSLTKSLERQLKKPILILTLRIWSEQIRINLMS